MHTKRNHLLFNRYRYEIAAAVILTLAAIGLLAATGFNYKAHTIWSSDETIQSPLNRR